jgi:Na+/proline symporter
MGVLLGSGVVPIALCITWSKANKWGCISGSIAGLAAGLIAWLVTTSCLNDGVITVATSGGDFEMLAGNLASIGTGGIIATITSLIWPDNFDWEATRAMNKPAPASSHRLDEKSDTASDKKNEARESTHSIAGNSSVSPSEEDDDLNPEGLKSAFKFATYSSLSLFVVLILLIPLPLFFSSYVYTKNGLTGWVAVGIAWTFLSAIAVVIYPLWESRTALLQISSGLYTDLFTKRSGKYVPPRKGATA